MHFNRHIVHFHTNSVFFLKISYMQKVFYYDKCSSALEIYFFTRNISRILNLLLKFKHFYIFYLFSTLVYLFIEMQHIEPIHSFKYIALLYVKDILL